MYVFICAETAAVQKLLPELNQDIARLFSVPNVVAGVGQALAHFEAGLPSLVHVHGATAFETPGKTSDEQRTQFRYVIGELERFTKLGGRVLWTAERSSSRDAVHLKLRRRLGEAAHRILVRDEATASAIALETGADRARIDVLDLASLPPADAARYLAEAYSAAAVGLGPVPSAYDETLRMMNVLDIPPDTTAPVGLEWPGGGKTGQNWGDKLNPVMAVLMSGRPVVQAKHALETGNGIVYRMIGSSLAGAKENGSVWGTGFIDTKDTVRKPGHVGAVRGPLSRAKLQAAGIPCPEVYGDVALLLPLFYRPNVETYYDIGVIQHFRDAESEPLPKVPAGLKVKVIDILGSITGVIADIVSCRSIVSSSLHGLIAAHAYGVPATWVKFSNKPLGDDFKFRDYLASVGWDGATPITMNADSDYADFTGPFQRTTPRVDILRLIAACPFSDERRKQALIARARAVYPRVPEVAFVAPSAVSAPAVKRVASR